MFKINLIPEVKKEQVRLRKINLIVTTVATAMGITLTAVTLILLGIFAGYNVKLKSIADNTKKIEEELVVYQDLEKTVVSLEHGLRQIKSLINRENIWTKFFGEVEKATPQDVQIVSLGMAANNGVTMKLVGRDTKSVDRFVKSFSEHKRNEKNVFLNVAVEGYIKSENGIGFDAKLDLNKEALYEK